MVAVAGLHPRVYKLITLIISHNANSKKLRIRSEGRANAIYYAKRLRHLLKLLAFKQAFTFHW